MFDSIRVTLGFLSFEDLPEEDQPPRSIWLDMDALKAHFDEVKRRRKEGMSEEPIEDPVVNEAARDLIR